MARKKDKPAVDKPAAQGPQSVKVDAKVYAHLVANRQGFESASETLTRLLNVGGKK